MPESVIAPSNGGTSLRRLAVYGDVDLNIIDGSAIWLVSLVEVLRRDPSADVTVLLKAALDRDVVTEPLRSLERVLLIRPADPLTPRRFTPAQAVRALEDLDRSQSFDVVVLRGFAVCVEAARSEQLRGRLWVYLTDIPQSFGALDDNDRAMIRSIASSADRVLCQTDELRSFLEHVLPQDSGKLAAFPPMIPARTGPVVGRRYPQRVVYAGKFAPKWGFLEMVSAFSRVRRTVPDIEFHVVGDKIHRPHDDPDYYGAVMSALESTDGLTWHGGVTRDEVARVVAGSTLAISARHADLDDSLELSTKVLEYGSAGVPVVLNRTPMHERLLGTDYPFFVDDIDRDLEGVIHMAIRDNAAWLLGRDAVTAAAGSFTFERSHERLTSLLRSSAPGRPFAPRRPRVLVAGHDLKFFTKIGDHLTRAGFEVRHDEWKGNEHHEESVSRQHLEWAEVVICEWCLGNAVWYSTRIRANQRLIIRLHRVEAETDYPSQVRIEAVDRLVVVSDAYRQIVVDRFGWPESIVQEVGNDIDIEGMDRPKLDGARHHLGIVGYAPRRKRLDRALDLIERLRVDDVRWRLYLKGSFPWEVPWIWHQPQERSYLLGQFERIGSTPSLREAVTFDRFGADVGSFFRKVGFVLSPSEDESFHVGLAEGMAGRSVPVIWDWAAASSLYPGEWIHSSTAAAADAIRQVMESGRWASDGERAREHVAKRFDRNDVCEEWVRLVSSLL